MPPKKIKFKVVEKLPAKEKPAKEKKSTGLKTVEQWKKKLEDAGFSLKETRNLYIIDGMSERFNNVVGVYDAVKKSSDGVVFVNLRYIDHMNNGKEKKAEIILYSPKKNKSANLQIFDANTRPLGEIRKKVKGSMKKVGMNVVGLVSLKKGP